ncbi:MAG TPA: VWA domain-containing protein [Planctomycetota bacterium]|nr:VWA domain-containing protein [Planctomycetota bacterium]
MEWQNPQAFYFVLPLLAGWLVLALYARGRRARAALAFAQSGMRERLMPVASSGRFWTKTILFALALLFGLLALARPRFGTYFEEVRPRGADIYVLIDVSKSMLADDVPPSRLARAKADVAQLLNTLNGERVGLIAFAGKAAVKVPLTTDYGFFRIGLNELDPNSAPRGGTAIGDAIRKALEVMPPESERDRAILLITDGDDQESYPKEAAEKAAEQHVAIYAVGLGDPNQGARVPVKASQEAQPSAFMTHNGEQVWSKLNDPLLREIALKTGGVYVPARTSAYDLGELYKSELSKRRGGDAKITRRERTAEQYQWFLGLAIVCWLIEMMIPLYSQQPQPGRLPSPKPARAAVAKTVAALLLLSSFRAPGAEDSRELVREGIQHYEKSEFDAAADKFKASDEATQQEEGPANAIAAFDLACAYHRKGDTEKAREQYLKAALSKDRSISSTALYNLGNLSAEKARTLAGEKPEEVEPDKREEILNTLKEAVVQYRNCLDVQPTHAAARKNIELIRQWIKLYKEKWRQRDREKLRHEMDLLQFLEYLIGAEQGLRQNILKMDGSTPLDAFADHKRAQDELIEEIEPLKEKISAALKAPQQPQPPGVVGAPPTDPVVDPKKAEEMLKALNGFADQAGRRMLEASAALNDRKPPDAASAQKLAIDELEKIWSLAAPFQALLQRAYREQSELVSTLDPDAKLQPVEGPVTKGLKWFQNTFGLKDSPKNREKVPALNEKDAPKFSEQETAELHQSQEANLRRTTMMKIKAGLELEQLKKQPAPAPQPPQPDPKDPKAAAPQPDPEAVKKGLEKAVELAPQAEEAMKLAIESLKQKNTVSATPHAEHARRILEDILKAQPQQKQDDQQKKDEQKNQDQNKQDQQKNDQQKKDDQEKQDKKDQQKKDEQNKEQQNQPQAGDKNQPMSKEQAEAILRQIREREQERRKKQQEEKAKVLVPSGGVDKDW